MFTYLGVKGYDRYNLFSNGSANVYPDTLRKMMRMLIDQSG